MKKLM